MSLRRFINWNISASRFFEKAFKFERDDSLLLRALFTRIGSQTRVADVGGGKKPAKILIGEENRKFQKYDGFDIDLKELNLAHEQYDNIFYLDLTSELPSDFSGNYDAIICLNTLEHVEDCGAAIKNLSEMLADDGVLYMKLPCRHAMFAKLNLILPQHTKKTLLHFIYPSKVGDGFKVFYDKSTPAEMTKLIEQNGLEIIDLRLIKWSSYFSFFIPAYVTWRLITCIQDALIHDYCESFEILAKREFSVDV